MKSVIVLLSLVSAVAFATEHKVDAAKADGKANVEAAKAAADTATAHADAKVEEAKNKKAAIKAEGKANVKKAKANKDAAVDAAKEATK